MSNQKKLKTVENLPKHEYLVEVNRIGYGYVRVRARSKDEAENVVARMNKKKLLTYYKEKYEFVNTGKATLPNDH